MIRLDRYQAELEVLAKTSLPPEVLEHYTWYSKGLPQSIQWFEKAMWTRDVAWLEVQALEVPNGWVWHKCHIKDYWTWYLRPSRWKLTAPPAGPFDNTSLS